MNFREFVESYDSGSWQPLGMVIPNTVFGALPSSWTNDTPTQKPFWGGYGDNNDFALGLPSVQKSGIIKILKKEHNPIYVVLQDANEHIHRLYIPYQTWKNIQPEPEIGRTLAVVFDRRPEDRSEAPTKISSIRCF